MYEETHHCVACSTVDNHRLKRILAIVNHDSPDIDHDEERDVRKLLQREHEGENVVGDALRETVQRVERMAGKGRRNNPLVVGLVQVLVDKRVVQAAVDPVDEGVCEEEEEGELQNVVPPARTFGSRVVHFAPAADFSKESGDGQEGHDGHRCAGLLDLH